ncbi:MAG: translation initiation factor IF-2 N-terminal domain-containing protein, partial [Desulfitobacteriaceae bacterium]|nr:translation initiation factor IF-2 N-terminal domain-containing protein [Desulfitobacteriaceae bacterium]
MTNSRVHELAKELNISSRDLIAKLEAMGVEVKNHLSTVVKTDADRIRDQFSAAKGRELVAEKPEPHTLAPGRSNIPEESGSQSNQSNKEVSSQRLRQEPEAKSAGRRPAAEERPQGPRYNVEGRPVVPRPDMEGRPPGQRPPAVSRPTGQRPAPEGRPPGQRPPAVSRPTGQRP